MRRGLHNAARSVCRDTDLNCFVDFKQIPLSPHLVDKSPSTHPCASRACTRSNSVHRDPYIHRHIARDNIRLYSHPDIRARRRLGNRLKEIFIIILGKEAVLGMIWIIEL